MPTYRSEPSGDTAKTKQIPISRNMPKGQREATARMAQTRAMTSSVRRTEPGYGQTRRSMPAGNPSYTASPRKKKRPMPPPSKAARPTPPRKKKKAIRSAVEIRQRRRHLIGRVLLTAVMLLVIVALAVGIFAASVGNPIFNNPKYTYRLGPKSDPFSSVTYRRSSVVRDGVLYMDMTDIAAFCGMTTTGTAREIRYITDTETSDNVRFVLNSPIAYINDTPIRLQGNAVRISERIWVPVSFVERYLGGVTLTVDEENNSITCTRIEDENAVAEITVKNTDPDPIYVPVYFKICQNPTCKRIAENSLPTVPVVVTPIPSSQETALSQ